MHTRDEVHAVVTPVWRDVLGRSELPADADFFELGGDSIQGARLMGRLRELFGLPLPLQLIFFHPALPDFTTAVGEAAEQLRAEPADSTPSTAGPLPLSAQQEELWVADQLTPGNLAYTELLPLRLTGPLDVAGLQTSVDALVARHESLRTRFPTGPDGVPHQDVLPALRVALDRVDVADVDKARQVALDRLTEPFDLAEGPLVRAVLLDIDPDDHVFLLYAHHIVADGLSLAVLCDELADHYAGRGLPQPAPTTRDRRPADLARQLEYWKQQLHGVRPLDLPLDRPRAAVRDNGGSRLRSTMSGELRDAVRALAREEGATQFVALLAAFQVLLGRWAGTEDVAIGSPVSARSAPELERVVGYLVTMATFRGDLSGDPSFRELLRRTRDVAFGALANSDVPFTSVVAELAPERDQSRPPIFSATLVSQPTPPTLVADLGDVTGVSFPVPRRYSTYDLTLYAWDAPDELIIDIEYATALFDTSTARRLAEQFARLVEGAVAAPDAPLSTLEILPEPELRKVVRDWNDTAAAFALDRPVHELVTAQVQRAPDRIAVVEGDREVTYAELHDRATVLARRLREHGVGPDVVVAVRMARSVDQLVALLAVWHSGGAYLPLDPAYPAERLDFMITDSGARLLVTAAAGGGHEVLPLDGDAPAARESTVDDLAYVIYTSGSTGEPKGVLVPHRGILNRILWMQHEYGLTEDDVMLQNAAYTFDFSVWEFFGPLVLGARVVLPDADGHRDNAQLVELIARHGVTTVHFVPSMLRYFLAEPELARCTGLRRVFSGGEPLPTALVAEFSARLGHVELHNLYGPTETSVDVTHWPVARDEAAAVMPIGRPIDNTTCYVLDDRMRPQPIGVPGELHIGGVQLARGYLGKPGLTAERFVADPFGPPGGRLYRTGDRVRWRADGVIEFLGRIDRQAKVRGFRVEPGEVEAALTAHPGVREAAVVVREDEHGERRLVAYLVGEPVGTAPLRAWLADRLPDHSIPTAYVELDRLPLSPSGKLDHEALAAPTGDRPTVAAGYSAPVGEREELLAGLWSDVLGVDRIGRDDNFFELGGDSIRGIHVIAKARRAGLAVTVPQLFRHQTIAELAAVATAVGSAPAPAKPVGATFPLTALQIGMVREADLAPGKGMYVVPAEALLSGDVDPDALRAAFAALIAHQPVLRTSVSGDTQTVHPAVEPVFSYEDWSAYPEAEQERRRHERLESEWRAGFRLDAAPLSRLRLARLADDRHSMVWTRHNVLLDGWSYARLFDELLRLHAAIRDGEPVPELAAPESFGRYVDWLAPRAEAAADALWTEFLADLRPVTLFDPAPIAGQAPYEELRFELPAEAETFVHRSRLTLSAMLEGAWAAVLARHTATTDVRYGLVFSTRPAELPAVEDMLGLLINTLPSGLRVDPELPVVEWLRSIQDRGIRLKELATASLEVLRERAGGPLWDTLLLLHNYPHNFDDALPGGLRMLDTQGFSRVGAALIVSVDPRPLRVAMLFDTARVDADTVRQLGADLAELLTAMMADPDRPVGELLGPRPQDG
ncbi:non-ribosomal peptide synthetase [Umezawaea tangerina]|uniref:Amino acid adenylation domain-containing protein n=1 Tax=Umezawaea tangerina TaxID=84725 RepID=A0A2T0T7F6_9PSEU|nr:non-ribosomal peptide synthetase [Umezawaea tangerina]PRY41619.1 amino acid adenylation domain-containing protein [Umezawaea tangerina]